ncbi:hypothetical protein MKW92_048487 [Papaver armeniacum]|nr:hypothetical protein MKW92_048487 [Papaver armeniacum]
MIGPKPRKNLKFEWRIRDSSLIPHQGFQQQKMMTTSMEMEIFQFNFSKMVLGQFDFLISHGVTCFETTNKNLMVELDFELFNVLFPCISLSKSIGNDAVHVHWFLCGD